MSLFLGHLCIAIARRRELSADRWRCRAEKFFKAAKARGETITKPSRGGGLK